jgi:hypothetical protein
MKRYNCIKEKVIYIHPESGEDIFHDDILDYEIFNYEDDLEYDELNDEWFFDDEELGVRHYYDPINDEWYYYELKNGILSREIEQDPDPTEELHEKDIEEAFTKDKPKPEAGYEVKKMKRAKKGGGFEVGYSKTKKKGVKKKKTKLTKSQLKTRAKKAARTKKQDTASQKKATKKAVKTRKLNK